MKRLWNFILYIWRGEFLRKEVTVADIIDFCIGMTIHLPETDKRLVIEQLIAEYFPKHHLHRDPTKKELKLKDPFKEVFGI